MRARSFAGAALVAVGLATAAHADPVTYNFTGHVLSISDPKGLIGGSFNGYEHISGSYTFNPQDLDPISQPGDYYFVGPENGITIDINGTQFTAWK
jgi:hypothetical protein